MQKTQHFRTHSLTATDLFLLLRVKAERELAHRRAAGADDRRDLLRQLLGARRAARENGVNVLVRDLKQNADQMKIEGVCVGKNQGTLRGAFAHMFL